MSRTTTESPPSGLPGPRPQRRARLGMRAGSVLLAGLTAIAVATGHTAAVNRLFDRYLLLVTQTGSAVPAISQSSRRLTSSSIAAHLLQSSTSGRSSAAACSARDRNLSKATVLHSRWRLSAARVLRAAASASSGASGKKPPAQANDGCFSLHSIYSIFLFIVFQNH